ncbi:Uncharacterized protein Fot_50354 [Forsythia ovata]|uniref:Uncharacterized protein n=1 Tax=Forsythia ovata TaxID=205694 RepID=A0ABD1PXX8_9LAMI
MHVENEISMPIINVKIPHVAYLKLIMSKIRKDQINKTSATILDRHPIVTAKCTRSLSVFSQQTHEMNSKLEYRSNAPLHVAHLLRCQQVDNPRSTLILDCPPADTSAGGQHIKSFQSSALNVTSEA